MNVVDHPVHPHPEAYRARRFRPIDLIAGVTVALVLVPQSLAYAELAGMPAERGLYAAAIPLLVAAPLACSPYLQTGPVAITSLLTFGALSGMAQPGSDEYVALGLVLALIVGVIRLAIGLSRAGVIAYLMSQPMLIGFVPAATILIVASQLPEALGATAVDGGTLGRAWSVVIAPGTWQLPAAVMAAGALAAVFAGRRLHPLFPGVLAAAVAAILYSVFAGYDGSIVGTLSSGLPPVSFNLPWEQVSSLLVAGAVISVVGFAEAGSIARRFAAQDRVRWDPDREFVSQGAANVAAAFSGGFPVGGSFSRSSLNRLAGGYSRWSGAVTGVVVVMALFGAGVLENLPRAVLAAIVIAAVIPLVTPQRIVALWPLSRPAFLIAASTFAATLFFEPHVERGVLIGIGLSIAVHLWRELRIDLDIWIEDLVLHARPRGVLWFGAAQALQDRLLAELADHRDVRRLVIHMDGLGRLDITGAIALREVRAEVEDSGVEWELADLSARDRRLAVGVIEDDARLGG